MQAKDLSIQLRAVSIVFVISLSLTSGWAADSETVLYNFVNYNDGTHPLAGLIMDAAGNLYGTTYGGSFGGGGTVFELWPSTGGGWTETVLYHFDHGNSDGAFPSAGLIMDGAGNLYGTTNNGGFADIWGNGCYCGTVFELSPIEGGGWRETKLHSFGYGGDGAYPGYAGVIMDAAGNLYGVTGYGGIYGYGIVFELSPRAGGGWTETVLHSFGNGDDGSWPQGGLTVDSAGNLYGTTFWGGIYRHCTGGNGGCGTVFELSPSPGGGWTETVVHSFNGVDGWGPRSTLILDADGNLYGTTEAGGVNPCAGESAGCGTVFELSPSPGGGWTETVLHTFGHPATDGSQPWTGVTMDAAGNLYGATLDGGVYGYGTVFEMSPREGGGWTETVLHSFNGTDGLSPYGLPITDQADNLYGTTYGGGSSTFCPGGCGVVWEITP
jgi:uncharacterized repeat protein (TIGR03803 family)